ncbi:uncharacterized protein MKZ38_005626 [Zalerion maritima]|uniref:Aminoglycoside phosphotransferase domain-containing protein n=1 Tax=Zalerion maritima TaxID=339359 RepID=A0AAD5WNV7_9PEZI|nr:uncharacterized protein MKZ38_005626 [Zalerion maritima]
MVEIPWARQAVNLFFKGRKYPTQSQCNHIAHSVSGTSDIRNVETPGSMSYTVICTGRHAGKQDLVVSFREREAYLDQCMGKLARVVHGDLVPEVSYYGEVDVDMDGVVEAKHICFVRHLARYGRQRITCCWAEADVLATTAHAVRYFARSWSKPQQTTAEARAETLGGVQRRLALLFESSLSFLGDSAASKLKRSLPTLFGQEYRQALTHGDLSRTNILVNEDTYEITGIVDWSLAAILPFGMELDCLFLTTGYMNRDGWHDYACRSRLHEAFWDEFWSASEVRNNVQREKIRDMAKQAAMIGAILRYAFQRNADGSPSEALVSDGALTWRYLRAWLAA